MNNTDILYDHYKDTISETKKQEKIRNKLFVMVLIHIFILFLITLRPESISNTISDYVIENWKIGVYFSINIIQLFIMASMLYCVIRYYQINIQIEKNYPYIHKLEDQLANNTGISIGREGENYLRQYPKTQDAIYYCYKYIFPIVFMLALIYRFFTNETWYNIPIKIGEAIITVFLIVINILYVIDMKKNNKKCGM